MPHSNRPHAIALGLAGALLFATPGLAQDNTQDNTPGTAQTQAPAAGAEAPEAAATPGAEDGVIARLGDREFTQADMAIAAEDLQDTLSQLPADQREAYLLTYLADLERIADAARAAGVDQQAEFQSRMNYARDRTLMEAYLQQVGEEATTDEAARALYDEQVGKAEPQQEVRARHILVPTEEEAKALKQQLDEGADFAKLAEENSKDPGSAPRGGDLDYFTKEQMVPAFANVAFELENGQVSDPVESQFGWHIIKVEDRRSQEQPAFEQVEGQIRNMLAREAQRDLIMSLREENKLEVSGQDGSDLATDEAGASPAPAEGEAPAGDAAGQTDGSSQ